MNRLFSSGPTVFLLCFVFLCGATNATAQLGDGDHKYDLRVKSILEELEIEYEITDDNDFKIVLPVGDERTQAVFINSNTEFYDEMEIREVWALGYECEGPIPEEVANLLLSNSLDQKIGAWQSYSGGSKTRAMFAVKLSANAGTKSLLSVIAAVLTNTDKIEEQLSGDADKF